MTLMKNVIVLRCIMVPITPWPAAMMHHDAGKKARPKLLSSGKRALQNPGGHRPCNTPVNATTSSDLANKFLRARRWPWYRLYLCPVAVSCLHGRGSVRFLKAALHKKNSVLEKRRWMCARMQVHVRAWSNVFKAREYSRQSFPSLFRSKTARRDSS